MFATAEGLLTQQDRLNSDGLQEVFATNLFGHFLLVHHRLHTTNPLIRHKVLSIMLLQHSVVVVYDAADEYSLCI